MNPAIYKELQREYDLKRQKAIKNAEKRKKDLLDNLPKYKELANKDGKDIEVLFHPGFMDVDKEDINHKNIVFKEFYLSKNRKTEFDSVMKISERSVQ